MYHEKSKYYPTYHNDDPYYDEMDSVKHACVMSSEFSIQIRNRGIISSYSHIPSKWLRFTHNNMEVQIRQFPTRNTFQINTLGMKVEEIEENKFNITNPDFEVEIKMVFY